MWSTKLPDNHNYGFLHGVYKAAGVEFGAEPTSADRTMRSNAIAWRLVNALKQLKADFPVHEIADPEQVMEVIPVQFRPVQFKEVHEQDLLKEGAAPRAGHRAEVVVASPHPEEGEDPIYVGTASVVEYGSETHFDQLKLSRSNDVPEVFTLGTPNSYINSQEAMNFLNFAGVYLDQLQLP